MKYRAEIDGLRAIAVVPVVFYHAGFGLVKGGFVGVDIFFVISGYLITTIIKNDLDADKFSLVHFYERRARRILPALFLVILVALPLAWIWLPPRAMTEFAQSIISVSVFSSNIFFWQQSGYFDTATELKPLLHTWTLAIEEQYYIFFPLFLLVMKRFGNRSTVTVLVLAFIVSLALAHWGAYASPVATFYLLPTRAWELAIGSLTAFYLMYEKRSAPFQVSQAASLLGLGLILFSIFVYDTNTPYPSLYTLAPTIGSALIILFAARGTWVNSLLSLKLLVGIGLISYSAYLWHQPLLVFARYQFALNGPSMMVMGTLAVMTFPLSYLSWRFVEKPFRTRTIFQRDQIFKMASAGIVTSIAVGSVGIVTRGHLDQPADTTYRVHLLDYEPDNRALQEATWDPLRTLSGNQDYRVEHNPFDNTLWYDLDDERPKLLIVGDSFAKDLYNAFSYSEVSEHFQVARYGIQIRNIDETFFDSPNYRNADVVVISDKFWTTDLDDFDTVLQRMNADGKAYAIVKNIFEFDTYLGGTLTQADVTVIERARSGVKDGWAIQNDSDHAYYSEFRTRRRKAQNLHSDDQIKGLAARFPKLVVLDRMDYVCPREQKTCFSMDARLNKYFYDYGHNTLAASKFFGGRIDATGWFDSVYAVTPGETANVSARAGDDDVRDQR